MVEKLSAFLIEMAKDEEALSRFLKNPRAEAAKAGVPKDQISVLMQRDAHKIFQLLNEGRRFGIELCVWVSGGRPSRRPLRGPVRRARKTPKAATRRRR